ncbi:MAG: FlgD immunoglobulin-like domain containing protein, partial [Candidatus Edwardsbacteria bacterium]
SKFIVHSKLYQNAPNPFSKATEIRYQIPDCGRLHTPCPLSRGDCAESKVSLKIYNVAGQLVKTLVNEQRIADSGERSAVMWDGRDEAGKEVSSGVYFYRLKAKDFSDIKKMILLR